MNAQYTATLYSGEEQFAKQIGNNVDELYTWMLIHANGHAGELHGKIIDNQSQEILKTFRTAPIE